MDTAPAARRRRLCGPGGARGQGVRVVRSANDVYSINMAAKWTIGLDLRPSGRGALAFARWARERTQPPGALELDAVHVAEESFLLRELKHTHLADLEARLLTRAGEELELAGLAGATVPRVVESTHAERALQDAMETSGAEALVIGRRVGAHEDGFVRLGRVARRVLRSSPVATIVVPGDLGVDDFGNGPILLATDLSESSSGAVGFALRVAELCGREVIVVHIVPHFDQGDMFVPAATLEQLYHQLGLERGRELEAWIALHGLRAAKTALATGDVISRVLGIAEQESCPLVVCGSRRLGVAERIFTASVGSSLAAFGKLPVAIVPPA